MDKYITIPLSKKGKHAGKYEAIISHEDTDLSNFNWSVLLRKDNDGMYAIRAVQKGKPKPEFFYLHRIILERIIGRPLEKDEMPDHINRNGLDNRRENLRLATMSQNMMNTKRRANNTSGHKGVSWNKEKRKYSAKVQMNGIVVFFGYFTLLEDAIKARDEAAEKYHQDFARKE